VKISRPQLLLSLFGLAAVAAVAASPQLLQGRVVSALSSLSDADPNWLFVAALAFLAGFACTVLSWRAALAAAGGRIDARRAGAGLAVGSLVNAFAPAKLGDAVKVGLCSRAIDGPGRLWTTGGVYAALAAARSLVLAALLVAASATGALPLWPVFALVGMVGVLTVAARCTSGWRSHPRIARLAEGFASLERSPRAIVTVVGWTAGMVVTRLAATVAIAVALGLPHPVVAALVIMPALDVAAIFPLTPGNIGVGSGAVAMVLASRGIGTGQALGAGFAIQAVETLVSIGLGLAGLLYLAQPNAAVRRWASRAAVVGGSAGVAVGLGLVVVQLV
jgi:uncharacterized membrane protein YbhN (UPF0104 family)